MTSYWKLDIQSKSKGFNDDRVHVETTNRNRQALIFPSNRFSLAASISWIVVENSLNTSVGSEFKCQTATDLSICIQKFTSCSHVMLSNVFAILETNKRCRKYVNSDIWMYRKTFFCCSKFWGSIRYSVCSKIECSSRPTTLTTHKKVR